MLNYTAQRKITFAVVFNTTFESKDLHLWRHQRGVNLYYGWKITAKTLLHFGGIQLQLWLPQSVVSLYYAYKATLKVVFLYQICIKIRNEYQERRCLKVTFLHHDFNLSNL